MTRRNLLRASALFVGILATPALAQEPFISGVYLGSQALCEQAKSGSLKSVLDTGEYVLSAQGLKNNQEDCQFLRVDKARGEDAWLVSTLCISQGGNYPDLYSVSRMPDGRLGVMSVYGGEDGAADAEPDAADDAAAAPDAESAPQASEPDSDAEAGTEGSAVETGLYVPCPGLAAP